MSAIDVTTSYRRGLSRVLLPFQRAAGHSTVVKARLMLMMPCQRTLKQLASDLESNWTTVDASLRALQRDGLIQRIRNGGKRLGIRYELTPAGAAVFTTPTSQSFSETTNQTSQKTLPKP